MNSDQPLALATLVNETRHGGRARLRALGKLVSLIENDPAVADTLPPPPRDRPHVVGFTGPPGVGKSTAVDAAVAHYTDAGFSIGVLAVDPTEVGGEGAFLGDRLRLRGVTHPHRVFFRSLATRGALGGVNAAVPAVLEALQHCGCDLIFVETVGVGQNEVDIAALAHSTIVFLSPGSGDGAQASKAGLLDVADVVVVNQSDRDGSHALTAALRRALKLRQDTAQVVPVLTSIATEPDGLGAVFTEIDRARHGEAVHGKRPATFAARARLALASAITLQARDWADTPEVRDVIASLRTGEKSLWQAIGALRGSLVLGSSRPH